MFVNLQRLGLRLLPSRVSSSDDFGRACHDLSVNRPTCLVTWALMNFIGIFAPRGSLTDQEVTLLGCLALLMFASMTPTRVEPWREPAAFGRKRQCGDRVQGRQFSTGYGPAAPALWAVSRPVLRPWQ